MAAGLLGLLIGGSAVALAAQAGVGVGADPDRARIEAIVRDYILANPEIIPEAVQKLQERQVAKAVADNRAALETPFASAWAGAEDGDVVLVEFFDYACGFCERSIADVDRLLAEDPRLKVVWRDLPVLGPDSAAAAQVSLAAARQGKYRAFYQAMFDADRPSAEAIAAAAAKAGVAADAAAEYQAEIDKNFQLAGAVGGTGTPLFVIGGKVLQGAVGHDALKEAIAAARAAR